METSKLGAPGRRHLQQLSSTGMDHTVSLLLRGVGPFLPEHLEALERDGATIRTHAGPIVSLDVSVQAVPRVLAHDFVLASEVSSPLYPEGGSPPDSDVE